MAQIEKRPELFADTPDDALLLPSQVASIFGVPTDMLKAFLRDRDGLLPVLVDLKLRYRFGDVRRFYQSEEFMVLMREYEESRESSVGAWKKVFMETFSTVGLPAWLTGEMRLGLREAASELLRIRLAEEMGNLWGQEFLERQMEDLPQKVFERAQMEAAKFLSKQFDLMLGDPVMQDMLRERAIACVMAEFREHPVNHELLQSAADHERVRAAIEAAKSNQEKGWVYLIQGGRESDIKIGKTTRLSSRLGHHRSSNPRFQLIASLRGYTALEGRLHKIFHPYRIEREWFLFSLTIQEFLKQAFEAGLALRPEVTGAYGENEDAASRNNRNLLNR